MKQKTILIWSVVVCVTYFSCKNNNLYYVHHTKFDRFDYRIPCNPELVDKVNTNWLKHGRYNCHFYNQFVQDFPNNYRYCVIGLDVSIVKELFGKPNSEGDAKIEYIVGEGYAENMPNFRKLIFSYDKLGKVTDVTISWFSNSY